MFDWHLTYFWDGKTYSVAESTVTVEGVYHEGGKMTAEVYKPGVRSAPPVKVEAFHPSEFLEVRHIKYRFGDEPTFFEFHEIIDMDDPDALVGWALVSWDQSTESTARHNRREEK